MGKGVEGETSHSLTTAYKYERNNFDGSRDFGNYAENLINIINEI